MSDWIKQAEEPGLARRREAQIEAVWLKYTSKYYKPSKNTEKRLLKSWKESLVAGIVTEVLDEMKSSGYYTRLKLTSHSLSPIFPDHRYLPRTNGYCSISKATYFGLLWTEFYAERKNADEDEIYPLKDGRAWNILGISWELDTSKFKGDYQPLNLFSATPSFVKPSFDEEKPETWIVNEDMITSWSLIANGKVLRQQTPNELGQILRNYAAEAISCITSRYDRK